MSGQRVVDRTLKGISRGEERSHDVVWLGVLEGRKKEPLVQNMRMRDMKELRSIKKRRKRGKVLQCLLPLSGLSGEHSWSHVEIHFPLGIGQRKPVDESNERFTIGSSRMMAGGGGGGGPEIAGFEVP